MEDFFSQKTLLSQIRDINVGESREFPIEKVRTIRTYACVHGLESGKKYVTSVSREKKVIVVKRES
jgi:hypothetical protein